MIWPRPRSAPPPNPDLPQAIEADYEEAALIAEDSPRAAAALLRLCVEKLCLHVLGREKGNLNEMIGELVARGLDEKVQKMLDIVRVVGNGAVHPGTIDLADDPQTVRTLFALVNEIAEEMISKPERIATMYAGLPDQARAAIERRDAGETRRTPSSPPRTTSSNES